MQSRGNVERNVSKFEPYITISIITVVGYGIISAIKYFFENFQKIKDFVSMQVHYYRSYFGSFILLWFITYYFLRLNAETEISMEMINEYMIQLSTKNSSTGPEWRTFLAGNCVFYFFYSRYFYKVQHDNINAMMKIGRDSRVKFFYYFPSRTYCISCISRQK